MIKKETLETMEDLLVNLSEEIKGYNLNVAQQTPEYKFGLACYKVFGKELEQVTKMDIENVWPEGKGDGGIDIIYITEDEDGKKALNICQAKYGTNISKDLIDNAAKKMIETYNNIKDKKHSGYSNRLIHIVENKISEEADNLFFNIFLNIDKTLELAKNIDRIIKKYSKNDSVELRVFFKDDIITEMQKYQEQPQWVEQDKLIIGKGGRLEYNGTDARKDSGMVVNAKASSLYDLYRKYHVKGLFEQNLRFYTKKSSVDNPIKASIQNGGGDFWFHNNGIIIACEDYAYDTENVKLTNFSIINGCQTVSLIGQTWGDIDKSHNDKDFVVLCKIIKPSEGEDFEEFVKNIAKSANNQKPISIRDQRSNDEIQQKIKKDFKDKLNYFYEHKRGDKNKNRNKNKITNVDFGLIILSFYEQKPGTARNSKTTIFKSEPLYKSIFHRNYNYHVIGQMLELTKAIFKALENIDNIPETERTVKDFLNNGKYFVLAIIGYIFQKFYKTSSLWEIKNVLKKPLIDNFDDILKDIILNIGYFCDDAFDYACKDGAVTSMTNFLKTDNNYTNYIIKCVDRNLSYIIKKKEMKSFFDKIFSPKLSLSE